ncbi:MAG: YwiC-like family protein [Acidobacteriaceae bacterium]
MTTATDQRCPNEQRNSRPVLSCPWEDVTPVRRWVLVWPREHGAWGILLVSLITGAAIGLSSAANLIPLLWLTLAAIAAFCLRTPIENSMPRSPFRPRTKAEWRWVATAASVYIATCTLAGIMLWIEGAVRLIWIPALAAFALFALQVAVKRLGRAWRMPAEILAAFGMTLTAAIGYIVASGKNRELAIGIWLLNGLFAANQILYVQFRIRETRDIDKSSARQRKRIFLLSEAITAAAILAGSLAAVLPDLALIAFVPLLVRGALWSFHTSPSPLRIHRLGKTELTQAIVFGLLLVTLARIPGL